MESVGAEVGEVDVVIAECDRASQCEGERANWERVRQSYRVVADWIREERRLPVQHGAGCEDAYAQRWQRRRRGQESLPVELTGDFSELESEFALVDLESVRQSYREVADWIRNEGRLPVRTCR